MTAAIVRKVTGESGIGYGINIWEQQPPGVVQGVSTTIVAAVGEFPWGPEDEIVNVGQAGDLLASFCPAAFEALADYPAMNAFTNVQFPGLVKVVRVGATGAAKATSGALTAGGGTITIAAKYKGDVGNDITYTIAAGTDSGKKLTIAIGTRYTATYDNLAVGGGWDAIDDPYVDVTEASADADPSNAAATNLASGSDGTAVAADYVGSVSSLKGLQLFAAEAQDFDVLFVAACPESLKDSVNDGLELFANTYDKGILVMSVVDGQTASAAETYVSSRRMDRLVYPWPRVSTVDRFDPALAEIEIDGSHFAAVAIASVDPERSPGGAGGAQYLAGITDLETYATTAELDSLKAAGVSCWFIERTLGPILRGAVTTSITSGEEKIFRRRMTDFLTSSIANRLSQYAELPLDLVLASRTLGATTGAAYGDVVEFLEGLKAANRILDFSVDAFSENTAADIASGRWTILVSVRLYSMMEEIVLKANVGEFVQVAAA